jgi:hypothetical protein
VAVRLSGLGLVERAGVGPQTDLVDSSRSRVILDELVDLRQKHVAYLWVWHGVDPSVSRGPADATARPPPCRCPLLTRLLSYRQEPVEPAHRDRL